MTLIMLLVFLSLHSCKEEPSLIPDIYWGEASAVKNGEPWSGKIYAQPNEPFGYGFTVRIDVYNEQEFHGEALSLFKIPYAEQKNLIDTVKANIDTVLTGASYATLIDGDVVGDLYKVYNEGGTENFVAITTFDESTKEVKGKFQVTFVFDQRDNRSDPTSPDIIRFTNGRFDTKITDIIGSR